MYSKKETSYDKCHVTHTSKTYICITPEKFPVSLPSQSGLSPE